MPCTLGVSGLFVFKKNTVDLFSYFTSTFKREIKIHAAVFSIVIMIIFKEFFLIRGPAVYMEFNSVWSLKINFKRKLNFRNFLF